MANECTLIIKDDFKNVLILQSKVKKKVNQKNGHYFLEKRARETEEKCVNRLVKDSLKSIVFDLEKLFDYNINDEESSAVYQGSLKERIVLDKSYKDSRWIGKNDIENYSLDAFSTEVLKSIFHYNT